MIHPARNVDLKGWFLLVNSGPRSLTVGTTIFQSLGNKIILLVVNVGRSFLFYFLFTGSIAILQLEENMFKLKKDDMHTHTAAQNDYMYTPPEEIALLRVSVRAAALPSLRRVKSSCFHSPHELVWRQEFTCEAGMNLRPSPRSDRKFIGGRSPRTCDRNIGGPCVRLEWHFLDSKRWQY